MRRRFCQSIYVDKRLFSISHASFLFDNRSKTQFYNIIHDMTFQ